MLADVDVLGTLTSADDMVSPFDARRVVLVDWGVIVWFEMPVEDCPLLSDGSRYYPNQNPHTRRESRPGTWPARYVNLKLGLCSRYPIK